MADQQHNHEPIQSGVIVGCIACHDEQMEAISLMRPYMGWLKIDSAPKDGTWILLGGGQVDPHGWSVGTGSLDAESAPAVVAAMWHKDVPSDPGDWVFCYWDSAFRSYYLNPTHWMPIPAPPTT